MITPRNAKRGFTFLELTISIAILAFIMVVTYGALTQIIRAKKQLDDSRDSKTIADAILVRITRELQLAYPDGAIMPPSNKLKEPYPGQPRLLGKAQKGSDGASSDSISFLALEGGQYMPDGGGHTGVVQISYRAERDPEDKTGKSVFLIREEVPYTRPYENAYKKRMTFPVTRNLVSLKFRYFDGKKEQWVDQWGQPPLTWLPAIVKFTIKIRSPLGKIDEFTTSVYIAASSQDPRS